MHFLDEIRAICNKIAIFSALKVNFPWGTLIFFVQEARLFQGARLFQTLEYKINQTINEYNLEGIMIYSNTLSWMPYFNIKNCDDFGQNCEIEGFLSDYMDAICSLLNCSWTSHAPPDGDWGVRPKSGPFNKSGEWGGAMGSIINGEYHLSLSQWVWTGDRYGLVDFISTSANHSKLRLESFIDQNIKENWKN